MRQSKGNLKSPTFNIIIELQGKYALDKGRGYQAFMAEWNQRCREEAYENMAGLPYRRIVQKNVAQLRAWHELLHAAAGRVQATPEERQQQKRLRQDAIDNQVDLGERT
jgi:ATPase subunit of ABC transporter with duplicated ATPase domains